MNPKAQSAAEAITSRFTVTDPQSLGCGQLERLVKDEELAQIIETHMQEPQPAGQLVEELAEKIIARIIEGSGFCFTPAKALVPILQSFATSQQQAREKIEQSLESESVRHEACKLELKDARQQVAMDTECIERIRAAAVRDMFRADEAEAKLSNCSEALQRTFDSGVEQHERADKAESAVKTLRGVLETCEERFKQYAESHFKKKTVEADIKGMSNFEMVHVCVDALESTKEFA